LGAFRGGKIGTLLDRPDGSVKQDAGRAALVAWIAVLGGEDAHLLDATPDVGGDVPLVVLREPRHALRDGFHR
jgi:hypothetical protein